MNWWVFGGVVVGTAVLGYLGQRFRLFDLVGKSKAQSSGNGAGLIGIGDEIFAPARHEAAMELDRQTILPAPAPIAGDPLKDVAGDPVRPAANREPGFYGGRVQIDLDSPRRPPDGA